MKTQLKTPKQLGITKTQFRNLAKLITFVKDKVAPPNFNIKWFYTPKGEDYGDRSDDAVNPTYECGSAACFCGYGPLAGIKPYKRETWEDYGKRVFGANSEEFCYNDDPNSSLIWNFLFNSDHKNSKIAACRRGAYLLQNGLPEEDYLDKWEAPRSFVPDYETIAEAAK